MVEIGPNLGNSAMAGGGGVSARAIRADSEVAAASRWRIHSRYSGASPVSGRVPPASLTSNCCEKCGARFGSEGKNGSQSSGRATAGQGASL